MLKLIFVGALAIAAEGAKSAVVTVDLPANAQKAIGDVLPVDRCAVAREPREPPDVPIFEPLPGEDETTTAKRRQLYALMLECGTCYAPDVYDIPAENLDRDIAAHGGAKG